MKHTTTRKKMLLSSVAMLLVAMLALGSATFAWFTAQPTADAKGIKMYTQSGTGLLVLSASHKIVNPEAWSHHTILDAVASESNASVAEANSNARSLVPVSLSTSNKADGTTAVGKFYTTSAEADNAYNQQKPTAPENEGGETTNPTIEEATDTAYYSEKIYTKVIGTGKTQGDLKLTGVDWTVPGGARSIKNAVRVAVTDSTGKLIGIFANDSVENGYLDSTTYKATNSKYTPTRKGAFSGENAKALGRINNTGNNYISVYVYLDGEDSECYSTNVNETLTNLLENLVISLEVSDPQT